MLLYSCTDSSASVSVVNNSVPVAGTSFTFATCAATNKTLEFAEWIQMDTMKQIANTTGGVLNLHLDGIKTSDAGVYICETTVRIMEVMLLGREVFNVSVQSKNLFVQL